MIYCASKNNIKLTAYMSILNFKSHNDENILFEILQNIMNLLPINCGTVVMGKLSGV